MSDALLDSVTTTTITGLVTEAHGHSLDALRRALLQPYSIRPGERATDTGDGCPERRQV